MFNLFQPRPSVKLKSGFSVVEILVALGLVAVIGAGLASVMTNASKQQKGIQAKDQQRGITSEIRTLLNNKVSCYNSFNGRNPQPGFTVPDIKDSAGATGNPIFSVNGFDRTGLLTFTEFSVSGWAGDSGSSTIGSAGLSIKLSRVGDTGFAKELKPDIVLLRIKRDGAGAITECFSIGSDSDGIWQVNPSNSSQVFYDAGSVGVGVVSPNATFQVAGTITGKAAVINSTSTIDFGTGNLQYSNSSCGAFRLDNLKDGGTYTLIFKGATSSTCSFTAFAGSGVTALTVHLPPDHGATTAGKHTLYSFVVAGSDVYTAWITGY